MPSKYEFIRVAIIRRAVLDYQEALTRRNHAQAARLERFFRSGWGELLSYGHGEYIIDHTRKIVRDGKNGCS